MKGSRQARVGLGDLRRLRSQPETQKAVADTVRSRQTGLPGSAPGKPQTTEPVLDAADRSLFRHAMRFVRPLRKTSEHAPRQQRREPEDALLARRAHATDTPPSPPGRKPSRASRAPAARTAAPAAAPTSGAPEQRRTHRMQPQAHDPDALGFLRPGCGPDLLRGLRRGKWPIESTLDLHGCTRQQMDDRMQRFLTSCLDHGLRCVRIVHGKGYGSQAGVAVLKDAVRQQLGWMDAVQAWAQCQESDGGAGAVVVLLKAKERRQPAIC